jgi:hypothetical protein
MQAQQLRTAQPARTPHHAGEQMLRTKVRGAVSGDTGDRGTSAAMAPPGIEAKSKTAARDVGARISKREAKGGKR